MINVGLSLSRVYPQPFRWGTARCTSIKTLPQESDEERTTEEGRVQRIIGAMGLIDYWVFGEDSLTVRIVDGYIKCINFRKN